MNLRQLGTIGMYILIVLSIISCRISNDLAGKSYKYRSKKEHFNYCLIMTLFVD